MSDEKDSQIESDFREFEQLDNMSDYLENEYDHKAWILKTNFKDKKSIKLHDLLAKELSLSYLTDHELAFIYSTKMSCVEEWLSMGMTTMAKRSLVQVLMRLRLNTSIDGIETILQHGHSSVSITGEKENSENRTFRKDDEEKKSPKIGFSKIFNKIRRSSR